MTVTAPRSFSSSRLPKRRNAAFFVWFAFLSLLVLFNQADIERGDYQRTFLFEYRPVYGFNIMPIEAAGLLISPFVLLAAARRSGRTSPLGAGFVFALCSMFAIAAISGYARLGRVAGLAEVKILVLTATFLALSISVYLKDPTAPLSAASTLVALRSAYELVVFIVNPHIDPVLGAKVVISPVLVFHTSMAIVAVILSKHWRRDLTVVAAAALGTAAVLLCTSRTSILSLVLTGAFAFLFKVCNIARYRATPLIVHAIALATIGSSAVVWGELFADKSTFYRELQFWREDVKTDRSNSNQAHFDDLQRGVMLIQQAPVSGQGFGGELQGYGAADFTSVIHNEFLHFWVVFGGLGACVWLYIFIDIPCKTLNRLRDGRALCLGRDPRVFVAFLLVPYTLTRISVHPAFYFDISGTWLVANMLALEFIVLGMPCDRSSAPVTSQERRGNAIV